MGGGTPAAGLRGWRGCHQRSGTERLGMGECPRRLARERPIPAGRARAVTSRRRARRGARCSAPSAPTRAVAVAVGRRQDRSRRARGARGRTPQWRRRGRASAAVAAAACRTGGRLRRATGRSRACPGVRLMRWRSPQARCCCSGRVLGRSRGPLGLRARRHAARALRRRRRPAARCGCTVVTWDRDLDARVERTRTRPLAAGEVTPLAATAFLGAQLLAGLQVLLQLNDFSKLLGASSLLLVGTYPLMKRVIDWPQAFLGLTINWGALLGWAAVHGELDASVVLPLYAGSALWTLYYDTVYAHQDRKDDEVVGVLSSARALGRWGTPPRWPPCCRQRRAAGGGRWRGCGRGPPPATGGGPRPRALVTAARAHGRGRPRAVRRGADGLRRRRRRQAAS